jgi:hypothetical protein
MAGVWGKPSSWPRDLMSTCRKQSQNAEILLLNGWSGKVEILSIKVHEIRDYSVFEMLILWTRVPACKTFWCFALPNLGLCSSPRTISCSRTYNVKTSSVIVSQLRCTHGRTPIHAQALATETVHHNSTTKEEGERAVTGKKWHPEVPNPWQWDLFCQNVNTECSASLSVSGLSLALINVRAHASL